MLRDRGLIGRHIGVRVQRLVPAILEAWLAAEREIATLKRGEARAIDLSERANVLQEAHELARHGADRETVVRFLTEHGLVDIIPETATP